MRPKRSASGKLRVREYRRSGDAEALEMVIRTLMQMEKGGVFDHIGGGFHRYSVDRFWRMPHFEKMLYDQAQIAISFIDGYLLTKDEYFSGVAKSILDYVLRKLTSPEGGFYSAEDAESSISHSSPEVKREGEFYAWEKAEVDTLLGEDSEMFCYYFGVFENGNAPAGSDPHDIFVNKNILYRANSVKAAAEKFGKPAADDVKNCPSGFKTSVHQIGILEVIDLSGLIGRTPITTIIGIEPKSLDMGMELSPEISEKMPRIIEIVLDEVNRISF